LDSQVQHRVVYLAVAPTGRLVAVKVPREQEWILRLQSAQPDLFGLAARRGLGDPRDVGARPAGPTPVAGAPAEATAGP
jgi:hypothetical protein